MASYDMRCLADCDELMAQMRLVENVVTVMVIVVIVIVIVVVVSDTATA